MREKINEELLCILRKTSIGKFEVEFVKIDSPFSAEINELVEAINSASQNFQEVINYIQNSTVLKELEGEHRYCQSLNKSYQRFTASNSKIAEEIENRMQWIAINKKHDPEKVNEFEEFQWLKTEIVKKYILWHKAYSIKQAYRKCSIDSSILTFSHRIDGWSNPVHQLTSNFSVELKTNFGFGHASYFYAKLKFKNVDISPFSEWIDYEKAKFSEIIRYSRKFTLANQYWEDAMEYAKEACNLSLTDEQKFVEIYIMSECERMVSGLEALFTKDEFWLKTEEGKSHKIDKKGHVLIEFRGEKISGALDFVAKIFEFEKIAEIKNFISRIESCNEKIKPVLDSEEIILESKIPILKEEINTLKPDYDKAIEGILIYEKRKSDIRQELQRSGMYEQSLRASVVEEILEKRFPEYKPFVLEYKRVTENYRIRNEQLQHLTTLLDKIVSHKHKIRTYFDMKN